MKLFSLIAFVLFFAACSSSTPSPDAPESAEHACCDGAKHADAHAVHHAAGHSHDGDKRECCSDKKTESCDANSKDAMTCSAEPAFDTTSEKITRKISKEEFAKVYAKNRDKLGNTCTNPAMVYCGKTSKDQMVSENEASCLWTKVFRVSRERLPELDNTPCAKMIKGFAKK